MYLNKAWFQQLVLGLFVSAVQISLVVLAIWLAGGISFSINSNFTYQILLVGFYGMACAAIMEELLFIGFVFQRLVNGIGFWFAQILLASAFVLGHFTNMDLPLDVRILGGLDLTLFALMLGVAYQKRKAYHCQLACI